LPIALVLWSGAEPPKRSGGGQFGGASRRSWVRATLCASFGRSQSTPILYLIQRENISHL